VRPEVDRATVRGEALQEGTPVAELLVELDSRVDAVVWHVELDVCSPRDVLEPVLPERAGVGDDGVEVDGESVHRTRC
jgi:hypothetical protein